MPKTLHDYSHVSDYCKVHEQDEDDYVAFVHVMSHPYSYIDLERDADVHKLLDSFKFSASEIPVVICRGQVVLRDPTNQEIAWRVYVPATCSLGFIRKSIMFTCLTRDCSDGKYFLMRSYIFSNTHTWFSG